MREHTGRGPTRARTTISDGIVLVMLEGNLTAGERTLVQNGRDDLVLEVRTGDQNAMRADAASVVIL